MCSFAVDVGLWIAFPRRSFYFRFISNSTPSVVVIKCTFLQHSMKRNAFVSNNKTRRRGLGIIRQQTYMGRHIHTCMCIITQVRPHVYLARCDVYICVRVSWFMSCLFWFARETRFNSSVRVYVGPRIMETKVSGKQICLAIVQWTTMAVWAPTTRRPRNESPGIRTTRSTPGSSTPFRQLCLEFEIVSFVGCARTGFLIHR